MLEYFFDAPCALSRLRSGPSREYVDRFAHHLQQNGYSRMTARNYLRSASHVGRFIQTEGRNFEEATPDTVEAYARHFDQCLCPGYRGRGEVVICGAKRFLEHLAEIGVARNWRKKVVDPPPLVAAFRNWLVQHRGSRGSTLYRYCRGAGCLITSLGDDPSLYDAENLRAFILDQAQQSGPGAIKSLISAVRAFLRYLAASGACRVGLDQAIPPIAGWRLASQPQSLGMDDIDRILDACHMESLTGIRDRAVILLLARLGLRAGDVANLRFSDLDWTNGELVVSGKSRCEARLPLPQEVGDALLEYIERRPVVAIEQIFLRIPPPRRPLGPSSISQIVGQAMRRAGVVASTYGSHILRHSVATEMLRRGISLYEIGTILRHRSYDQTAYYAKVDFSLLKSVAQPWPEVLR